ncbi:unnamed protein product [Ilex paraguariensis]|uniref:Uncharacterized protein n=1 Tax=Ilex paraguariensis TaxID=185542 RepID=A0ABC8TZV2_9AQUA
MDSSQMAEYYCRMWGWGGGGVCQDEDISVMASRSDIVDEQSNVETYIVHLKKPDDRVFTQSDDLESWYQSFLPKPDDRVFTQSDDLESWYQSFLPVTTADSNEPPRMVYAYRTVVTGFAAKLSAADVKTMEKKDGFVTARPQKVLPLHTTHSPNFLGLQQNLGVWSSTNYGKGVIIGVIDSGISPNHPSFRDEGMSPPPAKWKGKCELNSTYACNNKLIGVRSFIRASDEIAVDDNGHGTHTASTGANVFGNANGTAVGVAPLAHLAIYKVCSLGCAESDILAGMDAAIEDGVDVLSISLGRFSDTFSEASVIVGAFTAMQKGIFVSCSAGNSGPFNLSIANEAPWVLTVGASTIDRSIRATALLGNTEEFDGESVFQPKDFPPTLLPLVYPQSNGTEDYAPFCATGSLNNTDVKGKVVLCDAGGPVTRVDKGQTVKDAGGAAMILMNQDYRAYTTFADVHVLPATHVSYADGLKIKAYINSTSRPMATILFKGTIIGANHAPMVAAFSSRGPNGASLGILKPDIIGPGVNILAAWPFSVENKTDTKSTFNIVSGTSMSCPHLSGIAALLKAAHPNWSPAAIKSAIMTTADQLNLDNKPIINERLLPADIFAIGAGHVNPSKANDPGLVYDIQPDDYISYLCGLNYTRRQLIVIVQRPVNCSKESTIPEAQLNYPSFSIIMGSTDQTYTRTVTNVGEAISSYTVEIFPPQGVDVSVKPTRLDFSDVNQQMTYQVTFSRSTGGMNAISAQGFLKWTSTKHVVRSPIAILFE